MAQLSTALVILVMSTVLHISAASNYKRLHKYETSNVTESSYSVQGRWIVDEFGRVRIFRGLNSVQKGYPWYPEGGDSDVNVRNATVLKLMSDWGFNVVRLGTMWSGTEPSKGQYNQTYLNIIGSILKQMQTYGVVGLLDMHQDVMSARYGTYDGFPQWAVESFSPPRHPFPWPFKKIRFWSEAYATEEVGQHFQDFYNNIAGVRDAFIQMWRTVAKKFNNKDYPNVLGYEIINEPWAGDVYDRPELILPGNAGKQNLMPLYDDVTEAFSNLSDTALLFYEPVTWSIMRSSPVVGTGFSRVPGGDSHRNRSVLAWHYYCWFITPTMDPHNMSQFQRTVCDDNLGPHVFDAIDADIALTGGASFLTEFGECKPDGNPQSVSSVECKTVLGLADKHMQSWTYWDSAFFDSSGNVKWNVVKAFSRPYARATAGIPTQMEFEPTTKLFKLRYKFGNEFMGPTEVYVPPLHYPKGIRAIISDGFNWQYNFATNTVFIVPSSHIIPSNEVYFIMLPK